MVPCLLYFWMLDVFLLSFYRPFIFMFSVFSASFGSFVLSVLFTINNHCCSADKLQSALGPKCPKII